MTDRPAKPGSKLQPLPGAREAALVHELELHQIELEAQNAQLVAANEELRRAHASAVGARDRYRALYELAPTPYLTIARDRTLVDANHAAARLLATGVERLLGADVAGFVADADRAKVRAFTADVFTSGRARCEEIALAPGAGAESVLIDGVTVEAADDAPRGVLALVDISARKQVEAARRRAQEELLAIVSHDLRGPLNAIALACDALAEAPSTEAQREVIATITTSVDRGERLLKNLLSVAHLESGMLRVELGPCDLRDVVALVCRDHVLAAAAVGARVTLTLPDVPAPILGDRDRLHQVMSNLLGNALLHARGAPVDVSVAVDGDTVLAVVADHGPGIPEDDLPHVFERYRQGARPRGGAGLGLAIASGLIVAHGGTITASSDVGQGARFVVTLPLARRAPARNP
ncbi:MAG: PAS domain-containing sensor histidine kinase [Deltaproteobacteria bacterium]|nr:PAS domain-containing sensor histidine kinase [Deltaproteobacteria bacterium]